MRPRLRKPDWEVEKAVPLRLHSDGLHVEVAFVCVGLNNGTFDFCKPTFRVTDETHVLSRLIPD